MKMRFLLLCALLAISAVAQPNPMKWNRIRYPDGGSLEFRFEVPPGYSQQNPANIIMLIVDGKQDRAAVYDQMVAYVQEAAAKNWALLVPVAPRDVRFDQPASVERLGMLLRNLRTGSLIQGNRIHMVSLGDGFKSALKILGRYGFEFGSLTAINPCAVGEADIKGVARSAGIAVNLIGKDGAQQLQPHLPALKAVFRKTRLKKSGGEDLFETLAQEAAALAEVGTPEGKVGGFLDAWHDAAARADGDRYFNAFTKNGVFIGTDPQERWDVETFRKWSAQYFARKSAWVYVPTLRHVTLSPDGQHAWFDEVVWNASYGECRGTGSLVREDGDWRIALYNLSVPVPNEVMNGVVHETATFHRAMARGIPKADRPKPRTIYIVRHAEKVVKDGVKDPHLTAAGAARAKLLSELIPSPKLDLVISSEFNRTRETVQGSAKAAGLSVETHPARDSKGLARRLWALDPGESALVAGHSNTVGRIINALGVKGAFAIDDAEYNNLFILTLSNTGVATLQRLRFGVAR